MSETLHGSCHCGAHGFSAPAPKSVTRCRCSICAKRGSLAAYYAPDDVALRLTPAALTDYQWGDRMMTFHHCSACGCSVYAEHEAWSPDGVATRPARIILNARLFDDLDLASVPIIEVG